MSSRPGEDVWDFTPVIDFIHSLSISGKEYAQSKPIYNSPNSYTSTPVIGAGLQPACDSKSLLGNFDKIWQHLGQPLSVPPPSVPLRPKFDSIELLDNTASNKPQIYRGIKWRDECEGADLADNDEIELAQDISHLTKAQRKKARKKGRRQAQAKEFTNENGLLSESGNESDSRTQTPLTPDRRSVIYQLLHGTTPKPETGHLRSGKLFKSQHPSDLRKWPIAVPSDVSQPAQILKPSKEAGCTSAAAKKSQLLYALYERFIDDRQYLDNVTSLQNESASTNVIGEGIHVFVDASNIMIGFHDALKISRRQPLSYRIRRQPLSFHNLSLILERGRPAAKRIVVGSDNISAMQEAKLIGYETNILDRVHKAKELTPRQKRFHHPNGTTPGGQSGSGSETTAAVVQYAPEKWVEQAVDEILHLKMMESVVDASEPSTMILATGDAAEAEYSGGFLKMVERALGKGWKVELASFKHNTSYAYRKKEFRQKWGERFKTLELDDFVEELLGTE